MRDGADYIDCSVQTTKDDVPIYMQSPNLMIRTKKIITDSLFYPSRLSMLSDINEMVLDAQSGDQSIFTFDLTMAIDGGE